MHSKDSLTESQYIVYLNSNKNLCYILNFMYILNANTPQVIAKQGIKNHHCGTITLIRVHFSIVFKTVASLNKER